MRIKFISSFGGMPQDEMKVRTAAITRNPLVFAFIRGGKGINFNLKSPYWRIRINKKSRVVNTYCEPVWGVPFKIPI
jgi:hypothetical protein